MKYFARIVDADNPEGGSLSEFCLELKCPLERQELGLNINPDGVTSCPASYAQTVIADLEQRARLRDNDPRKVVLYADGGKSITDALRLIANTASALQVNGLCKTAIIRWEPAT